MSLECLKLSDVMIRTFVTVDENTKLNTVLRLMREGGLRQIPILHRGRFTGVVEERDFGWIHQSQDWAHATVSSMPREPAFCCSQTTPLTEAIRRLIETRNGCIVALNDSNQVSGILTRHDALRVVFNELGKRGVTLPLNLKAGEENRRVNSARRGTI